MTPYQIVTKVRNKQLQGYRKVTIVACEKGEPYNLKPIYCDEYGSDPELLFELFEVSKYGEVVGISSRGPFFANAEYELFDEYKENEEIHSAVGGFTSTL